MFPYVPSCKAEVHLTCEGKTQKVGGNGQPPVGGLQLEGWTFLMKYNMVKVGEQTTPMSETKNPHPRPATRDIRQEEREI